MVFETHKASGLTGKQVCREGPDDVLGNFTGYLQTHAFGGYDGIYLSKPIIEVLCNAHARRKFYEARKRDSLISQTALAYYKQLYAIGKEIKACSAAEQQMRPIALGHKNWLFFGSDTGGRSTPSAKQHGLNIFRYIENVLEYMPGSPMSKLSDWLPAEWLKRQNRLNNPPKN